VLIDGFSESCAELCVEIECWNREMYRSFYVGAFAVGVVASLSMPLYRYIVAQLVYQAESQLLQRIICSIAAGFHRSLLVAFTKDLMERRICT
jgi:hypothetical protein